MSPVIPIVVLLVVQWMPRKLCLVVSVFVVTRFAASAFPVAAAASFWHCAALFAHTISCPSASLNETGLLSAYAYRFQLWGFLRLEYEAESGVMKRPILDESYLAPKLSKPDSASRSLPVNLWVVPVLPAICSPQGR